MLGGRLAIPPRTESLVIAASEAESVAVRVGTGTGFGPWTELTHPLDEGPDNAGGDASPSMDGPAGEGAGTTPLALSPVLVSGDDTTVEVVLLDGSTESLQLHFVRAPSEDPADGGEGPPVVAGTVQTGPGGPTIVPRSGWTDAPWSADNAGCASGPWYADNIQAIVVHHTVTANGYAQDRVDDLLRAIHYSHVQVNGWCDVGYNFLVDRFGTIWEGRSGGVDRAVIGGHAKGFNTATMGVALLGQHQPRAQPTPEPPSTAATRAVTELAAWKVARHGIDPQGTTWLRNRSTSGPQRLASGEWHLVPTMMGHRHIGVTSCPGGHGLGVVDQLRRELSAPEPVDGLHQAEGWSPYPYGPALVALDRTGGLRPAGSASIAGTENARPVAPPSPKPVAVSGIVEGGTARGWTLHTDGVLHAFGGAPEVAERPAGDRSVVTVAAATDGGGWVVAADGSVHGFGGRPDIAGATPANGVIAADLDRNGNGYLLDGQGAVHPVGTAEAATLPAGAAGVVDIATRRGGRGGWVVAGNGTIHAFGRAPSAQVTAPVSFGTDRRAVAVVAAAGGNGGWVITDDGQFWPFGRERLVVPATTSTETPGVVSAAYLGSVLGDDFLSRPDSRYLAALSETFRHSPASPHEIERWDGWLTYRAGRREVALELARSPQRSTIVIEQFYRDALGRPPEPSGLAHWRAQVAAGASLAEVGVAVHGSAEAFDRAGSTPTWVDRLYRSLLGRPGEPAGVTNWTALIESGAATRPDVVRAFFGSGEYRRRQVALLYDEVLGRPPDPEGVAYWAQRLGQTDDGTVAAELAVSDEYYVSAVE